MAALDRLVDALEAHGCRPVARGDRWEFFCPAHADGKNRAGEARQGDKGAILHCHAGCAQPALIEALELGPADLFDEPAQRRQDWDNPDERYPYRDLTGRVLYEVRRIGYGSGKAIRPFMGPGADAKMGLPPERILYRLPEVAAEVTNCAIAIMEGERDVDAAWRAGVAATTNVGGAGKWRDSYSVELVELGAQCVVVADDDAPGHEHARTVLASLQKAGAIVEDRVRLPASGCKDFADHLAAGHGTTALRFLGASSNIGREWRSTMVNFSTLSPKGLEWWWDQRWPLGKITIVDGDPGLGKSFLTLDLAARASNGCHAPDGSTLAGGPTVILSAEDDAEDTILPRYLAAGGNPSSLWAMTVVADAKGERPPALPSDFDELEARVGDIGARLLVIDPLMAYLTGDVDSHKDQDIRRVMHRLGLLATKTHSCVLIVRHLNKSGGGSALYRGGGSIGIIGAARAGWIVAKDPKDPSRRIFAAAKANLAPDDATTSLCYRILVGDAGPYLHWDGTSSLTADQLMERPEQSSKSESAADWLADQLSRGPVATKELLALAAEADIPERTLRRAKQILGAETKRESVGNAGDGYWTWYIKDNE